MDSGEFESYNFKSDSINLYHNNIQTRVQSQVIFIWVENLS